MAGRTWGILPELPATVIELAEHHSNAPLVEAWRADLVGCACHRLGMDSITLIFTFFGLLVGLALGVIAGIRLTERSRLQLRTELSSLSAQALAESSHQIMALADSRVRATEQV